MSPFPNDPWPIGTPTPPAASAPPSAATVPPAAPKPSVSGCLAALAILLLAGNLGLGVYREFHARPSPSPPPIPAPPIPAPPIPPDPIADLRPRLLADGAAHGRDLARTFGQSLQEAASQIDGKTPLSAIQAKQAAAWQAKRKEMFDQRFAATLESIVPAETSKPTQAQIDRYKAALGAIGQGAIQASGPAQ